MFFDDCSLFNVIIFLLNKLIYYLIRFGYSFNLLGTIVREVYKKKEEFTN
jgi:hypothetical protein